MYGMDYFDMYENLIESLRYPLLVSYKTNYCKICLLAEQSSGACPIISTG